MKKKIKVLVVDDSAMVRQALTQILNSDPNIEVMDTASDPYFAAKIIQNEVPDVITLDVEMPRMDGLTFLKKIMSQHPIPVVIISSLTNEGTETAIKALEYGAIEIITKPQLYTKEFFEESKIRLCDVVKAASMARIKHKHFVTNAPVSVAPKYSADVVIAASTNNNSSMLKTTELVVAVGASTGGTEALKVFLENLPGDSPGIVIVQHMPENFTRSFANRLNQLCKITVKEAEDNDTIIRGRALIAPGNKHMLLKRSGARYYVEVKDGPLVNRHRPSVDVLFRSTARYAGRNSIGIIMTGMGDDGAKGLLEMKQSGAMTVAQDEKSCVVYGMPKEAVKLNAADKILPLEQLAGFVLKNQYNNL
ncbi:MAG: chemotaxis response regulator protein-glutamate methylesterase [Bacteroidetes bacterium GWE2_29_8]|nr:MAG: chemotaxis response regulator protein-glutamate methylesterase [Bacteroidetes bacterium GWE2_29_8]OFY20075.1 MAG: chemotaxis response regulator protein-glutamate methylesterase [Bacteroidetes bacterium GWF2_29_10]